MADATLFDLGVGVPGASEGIIDLIEFLKLPEIYKSYEGVEDPLSVLPFVPPMPVRDAIRYPLNVASDIYSFTGDLVTDIPAAAADYISEGVDLYNPFTEEGMKRNTLIPGIDFQPQNLTGLSKEGRDLVSSAFSNLTGLPSYTKDNPYANPNLMKSLEKDTQATIDSKYKPKYDNAAKIANDFVFDTLPSIQTYAANNPGSTREAYEKLQKEAFEKKFYSETDKFIDDYNKDYYDLRTQNSINMFGYDAFDDPLGDLSALAGPGIRKFDIGNFGVINQPVKYVGEGDYFLPFMEYESPAKKDLERLTFIGDMAVGIPAMLRNFARFATRGGTKKEDQISPELDEVIREYMRD